MRDRFVRWAGVTGAMGFAVAGWLAVVGAGSSSNVPSLREVYEVTLWLDDADCPDNELCDIYPAIQRILADCRAKYPGLVSTGCRIHIDEGHWRLSDTVTLCRQHTIYGSGGRGGGGRTWISVDTDLTAFRTADNEECAGAGLGWSGAWTEITDLVLESPAYSAGIYHYGVNMNARASVERLAIGGFTEGIRIEGTELPVTPCPLLGANALCTANANGWSVRETRISNSDHAGMHVVGGNANAGRADLVDVSESCRYAEAFGNPQNPDPVLGDCAAIIDDSFLGNTWIATQTATSRDVTSGTIFPGYDFRNDSQNSVLVGAYAETDQAPGYIEQSSMALGGLSNWEGQGFNLRGSRANRLNVRNENDPHNVVEVALGANAIGGTFVEFRSEIFRSAWPLRIKAEKVLVAGQNASECNECTSWGETVGSSQCSACWDGQYRFDVANLQAAQPFKIDASHNGDYPMGTMWMHRLPARGGGNGDEWCPGYPNATCP